MYLHGRRAAPVVTTRSPVPVDLAGVLLIFNYMNNTTMTLANLVRAYHGALTRNQLKVARARLRRAGVTNLNRARRNAPYHVNPTADVRTDRRAESGTLVAQVAYDVA